MDSYSEGFGDAVKIALRMVMTSSQLTDREKQFFKASVELSCANHLRKLGKLPYTYHVMMGYSDNVTFPWNDNSLFTNI